MRVGRESSGKTVLVERLVADMGGRWKHAHDVCGLGRLVRAGRQRAAGE